MNARCERRRPSAPIRRRTFSPARAELPARLGSSVPLEPSAEPAWPAPPVDEDEEGVPVEPASRFETFVTRPLPSTRTIHVPPRRPWAAALDPEPVSDREDEPWGEEEEGDVPVPGETASDVAVT